MRLFQQSAWLLIFAASQLYLPVALAASTDELKELYRGTRATGMGNAFTAVADDEEAIFLNPAGLAGVRRPRINLVPVTLEAATQGIATLAADFRNFRQFTGETLNSLIGKEIYVRGQLAPTLVFPNFGVGLLLDQQVAFYGKNVVFPDFTIGYQTTTGIQFSGGFSLNNKKRSGPHDFRIGLGGKLLWRRGGYNALPLSTMFSLSPAVLTQIQGTWGQGIGFDLGVQYLYHAGNRLTLMAGSAWTEIGDVAFSSGSSTQKSNFSAGVAARYKLPLTSMLVSYDYRHILDNTDPGKRHHVGVEVSLPLLTVLAGYYEGTLSYGVGLDLWLIRCTAVAYAEQMGALVNQDSQPRYLLQLSLGIGL